MFYIHPWEIDPDQPRMAFAKGSTRFRHYVKLRHTYRKLTRLLTDFEFGTMEQAIESCHACPSDLVVV